MSACSQRKRRYVSARAKAAVRTVAGLGLAALAAAAGACDGKPRDARSVGPARLVQDPSTVVLITVEAVRPDLLSIYGGSVAMPALDRLAAAGIVFDDAATACPMARPAVASLMTGLAPDGLGVRDNVSDRLPSAARTIAERFREAGWSTAAFVASPFCSYSSGFDRGFGLFDGPEDLVVGPAQHFPPVRPGEQVVRHFAVWLSETRPTEPLFAWVHLADLHGIATEGAAEEARAKYVEALSSVDAAVGAIWGALGASGRTASAEVVFAGTHGVHLGEQGARGDSFWLTRETLRVPLVWTGSRALTVRTSGSRSQAPTWLPDVGQTLATLAGRTGGGGGDGRDLFAPGPEPRDSPGRWAWTWAPDDQLAWPTLTGVEREGVWEVFDWPAIERLRDAGARTPSEAAAIARPATPRTRRLPAEARAKLDAAGFRLASPASEPRAVQADRQGLLEAIQTLRHHIARGRALPARRLSADLAKKYPENFGVLQHRLFLVVQGRAKRVALALARRLLDLYPDRADTLHWAGHAELLDEKPARAEVLLEAALSLGSQDPDILYDLACARALAGDRDRALERLREAVRMGFRNWNWLEQDPDLEQVRSDPRFVELLRAHGR